MELQYGHWTWLALMLMLMLTIAHGWSAVGPSEPSSHGAGSPNGVSPYLDLALCPIREQPWSCARHQSARILDVWDEELHAQWQKLKVEADRQLNATMERRGYSASDLNIKERPSTILKKIEIGTNYMKEYLAETMDGFLGREYEYRLSTKNELAAEEDDDEAEGEGEGEDEENDNEVDEVEAESEKEETINGESERPNQSVADSSLGAEFIEIDDADSTALLKNPGAGKRKKGQPAQPATLVVVQPAEQHGIAAAGAGSHTHGHGHGNGHGGSIGRPLKEKRRKRKKGQHGADTVVVVEEEPSNHLGLGLLEELVDADQLLEGSNGGKRKHKHPSNYGRSNGVTRGKKKKKKKALMKLMLLGTFLKAKIELLLKILGAHLQIKFFAIALIGLLINIARFWIDIKRGGGPQKVVYVEHAHHQHHYEDHGEDWGEQGGYWKRSLPVEEANTDEATYADSYQPRPQYDAHYMAYRNQAPQ